MTTNVSDKSPRSPEQPRKRYPLNPPSGHDHPYAMAANRIHALEWSNKQLLADKDNLERKVHELSAKLHELSTKAFEVGGNAADAIIRFKEENSRLSAENLSLRKLALHGLIYRLDSLINEELSKKYPNPGRVRRWSEERMRFTVAYERIKGDKE